MCRLMTASVLLLLLLSSANGQQLTLTVPANSPATRNDNFRLSGTTGFSVVHTPDRYHLYATGGYQKWRWRPNPDGTFRLADLYTETSWRPTSPCYYQKDPRDQDPRCSTDSVGYFWKRVGCPEGSSIPCQDNDWWNAWPGRKNIDAFAHRLEAIPWPRQDDWGTLNYKPIIDHGKINSVELQPSDTNCTRTATCPPKTGTAYRCHQYNPDEYATGAANSKAVQVKYADGRTRWFMAFNSMIKSSESAGVSGADTWRVMWATSPDGADWTVHPQILFRSRGETDINSPHCWGGPLVTDMFTDEGYFYMVFTDLIEPHVYLARSRIAAPADEKGYTTWEIAGAVQSNGQYLWVPVRLGEQTPFIQVGAQVMPTRYPSTFTYIVKQTSIARVFSSSAPGSPSRYIGVTIDQGSGGAVEVQLWSTRSLSEPFRYESDVEMDASMRQGLFGWEFGFAHDADNTAASPRVVAGGFDLWMVVSTPPKYQNDYQSALTVTRHTAKLSGL